MFGSTKTAHSALQTSFREVIWMRHVHFSSILHKRKAVTTSIFFICGYISFIMMSNIWIQMSCLLQHMLRKILHLARQKRPRGTAQTLYCVPRGPVFFLLLYNFVLQFSRNHNSVGESIESHLRIYQRAFLVLSSLHMSKPQHVLLCKRLRKALTLLAQMKAVSLV